MPHVVLAVISRVYHRVGYGTSMGNTMERKMTDAHVARLLANGASENLPDPPSAMVKLVRTLIKKRNVAPEQIKRIAKLMSFEFQWRVDRNWLGVRSFSALAKTPMPDGFEIRDRLIG